MSKPSNGFNPYLPQVATILETVQETPTIKTFRVRFDDAAAMAAFSFQPGQVGQLSVFGVGESTFVINSPPTRMEYLQFSVMRAGEVTTRLHGLAAGDKVGVRAPLGNPFPYNDMKGKDIVFIGGGIGMARCARCFCTCSTTGPITGRSPCSTGRGLPMIWPSRTNCRSGCRGKTSTPR